MYNPIDFLILRGVCYIPPFLYYAPMPPTTKMKKFVSSIIVSHNFWLKACKISFLSFIIIQICSPHIISGQQANLLGRNLLLILARLGKNED